MVAPLCATEGNTKFKVEIFPEDRFLLRLSSSDLSIITMLKKGSFESIWERNLTKYERNDSYGENKILKYYGDYKFAGSDQIIYVMHQYGEVHIPAPPAPHVKLI